MNKAPDIGSLVMQNWRQAEREPWSPAVRSLRVGVVVDHAAHVKMWPVASRVGTPKSDRTLCCTVFWSDGIFEDVEWLLLQPAGI